MGQSAPSLTANSVVSFDFCFSSSKSCFIPSRLLWGLSKGCALQLSFPCDANEFPFDPAKTRSPSYSASLGKFHRDKKPRQCFKLRAQSLPLSVPASTSTSDSRVKQLVVVGFVFLVLFKHTPEHSAADPGQSETFLLSLLQLISDRILNDMWLNFSVFFRVSHSFFSSTVGGSVTHRSPFRNGTWGNTKNK